MAKRWCAGHEREHVSTSFASDRSRVCKKWTKERTARDNRAKRLKTQYGITPEEDDALAEVQGKRCAGCKGRRSYFLHIDHDHVEERRLLALGFTPEEAARGSLRGKLCARCNKILRDARDSIETLEGLVAFLKDPPAKGVLQ